MEYELIFKAINRHFNETKLIIDQLTDEALYETPVQSGRSIGDVIMHLIRSIEYYSQGLAKNVWIPLTYDLTEFSTALKVKSLYNDIQTKATNYLIEIDRMNLNESYEKGNRPSKRVDVLLEMLEHSIQHRGQILVYYRLLGLEPAKISYII